MESSKRPSQPQTALRGPASRRKSRGPQTRRAPRRRVLADAMADNGGEPPLHAGVGSRVRVLDCSIRRHGRPRLRASRERLANADRAAIAYSACFRLPLRRADLTRSPSGGCVWKACSWSRSARPVGVHGRELEPARRRFELVPNRETTRICGTARTDDGAATSCSARIVAPTNPVTSSTRPFRSRAGIPLRVDEVSVSVPGLLAGDDEGNRCRSERR